MTQLLNRNNNNNCEEFLLVNSAHVVRVTED